MAKHATSTLTDEAAEWFVAMQRETLSPDDRQAFERWIDSDPAHAVAYARIEQSWERSERLNAAPPRTASEVRPASWHLTRRAAAAGLAALVAGGAGWWALARPDRYETAIGQRRTIRLADGSQVHLNTDTALEVAFAEDRRDIRMVRGEALFEVAKDRTRPFVVRAGESSVRAVGTAFNVRVRNALVEVTVTEGVVAIDGQHKAGRTSVLPSTAAMQVKAGGGAVVSPGAVTEVAFDPELLRQRLAWRDGLIQLNGETLEQAVAEFNRYRPAPLIVGDARLAGIRVGGTFEIDESDKFLAALQAGFQIRPVAGEGGAVYLMPAA